MLRTAEQEAAGRETAPAEGGQELADSSPARSPSDRRPAVRPNSTLLQIALSTLFLSGLSCEDVGHDRGYGYFRGRYPADLLFLVGMRLVSRHLNEFLLSSICGSMRRHGGHIIDFFAHAVRQISDIPSECPTADRKFHVQTTRRPPQDKKAFAEELLESLWELRTFTALRGTQVWDQRNDHSFILSRLLEDGAFESGQLRLSIRQRESVLGHRLRELRAEGITMQIERRTADKSPGSATALKVLLLSATTHRGDDYPSLKWMTYESTLYVEHSLPQRVIQAEELKIKRWQVPIAGSDEWLVIETYEKNFMKSLR